MASAQSIARNCRKVRTPTSLPHIAVGVGIEASRFPPCYHHPRKTLQKPSCQEETRTPIAPSSIKPAITLPQLLHTIPSLRPNAGSLILKMSFLDNVHRPQLRLPHRRAQQRHPQTTLLLPQTFLLHPPPPVWPHALTKRRKRALRSRARTRDRQDS